MFICIICFTKAVSSQKEPHILWNRFFWNKQFFINCKNCRFGGCLVKYCKLLAHTEGKFKHMGKKRLSSTNSWPKLKWEWVASFTLWPFYPQGKRLQFSLDGKAWRTPEPVQMRCQKKKKLWPCLESSPRHSACSEPFTDWAVCVTMSQGAQNFWLTKSFIDNSLT